MIGTINSGSGLYGLSDKLFKRSKMDRTLVCPMCGIDCIVGDASGFPVTDDDFIKACTEAWFGGYSRISDGKPIERDRPLLVEVD